MRISADKFITKYGLRDQKWLHKGYHGTLFFHAPITQVAMAVFQKYFGHHYRIILDYFIGEHGNWHYPYRDAVKIREVFLSRVKNDRHILDKLVADWKKTLTEFNATEKRFYNTNLSRLDADKLLRLYNAVEKIYIKEFALGICVQDAFSMTAEEFLLPKLERVLEKTDFVGHKQKYMGLLTTPTRFSFVAREELDRLRVRQLIKNPSRLTRREETSLARHAQNYHWIQNNYATVRRLDSSFFLNKIKNLGAAEAKVRASGIIKNFQRVVSKKKKLLKELHLDKETGLLVDITDIFAYMQDERKKYSLKAVAIEHVFLLEFAKRLKLPYRETRWIHFKELPNFLSGKTKINKKMLIQRGKYCVSVANIKNTLEVIEGAEAKKLINTLFHFKPGGITEIKGTIASMGTAKGKVKIILTSHDIRKMKSGCILVSTMTRPEMAVAMKKAAAIVTDEGGITSHAAILARELNIPCIIGTKIATKIFKDGDVVEVDANKGIVKKL